MIHLILILRVNEDMSIIVLLKLRSSPTRLKEMTCKIYTVRSVMICYQTCASVARA